MMESGPFRVDGKGGLIRVDGGWEEYTTMVFSMLTMSGRCDLTTTETVYLQVDQPAGTGLSYTSTDKYVHELTEVGRA
jgi:carboxypeptidase D